MSIRDCLSRFSGDADQSLRGRFFFLFDEVLLLERCHLLGPGGYTNFGMPVCGGLIRNWVQRGGRGGGT